MTICPCDLHKIRVTFRPLISHFEYRILSKMLCYGPSLLHQLKPIRNNINISPEYTPKLFDVRLKSLGFAYGMDFNDKPSPLKQINTQLPNI